MESSSYPLKINNAVLHLLPQNAIYWPEENTLLVADLHLGKEHVFARRGIAIPEGPSESTLSSLSQLLQSKHATRCIVLGDFFHDLPLANDSWLVHVSHFLDKHNDVQVEITAGNHDKKLGQTMLDPRIVWHSSPIQRRGFVLQHEPGVDERGHVLAGHLHPVASIGQSFQRRVRRPCFWHQQHTTVLPAFGHFTGGYSVTPSDGDQVFLAGPERVLALSANALAKPSRRASINLR